MDEKTKRKLIVFQGLPVIMMSESFRRFWDQKGKQFSLTS